MKKTIILVSIFALLSGLALFVFRAGAVPPSVKPLTIGASKYDSVRAMCFSKQGYMLAGMTMSSGIGYVDAYLVSLGKNGSKKWENTFGGKEDDRIYGIIKSDEGYVLGGYTSSYGAGGNDFYMIAVNEKGDLKFTKTFGGAGRDEAKAVVRASDGGYLIAGLSDSFKKAGSPRLYAVKTDASGNSLWSVTYGGDIYDEASGVINAVDGGYILCGTTKSPGSGMQDMLLLKIDTRGNTVWSKTYGGKQPDFGNNVINTDDGGYAIIGSSGSFGNNNNSDIYLVKTDADGDCVWARTYGGLGIDQGVTVINSGDGGYVLGSTSESFSYGSSDLLVIAVDSNGNSLWTKHFGGKEDDYLGAILKEKDGNYAICGWTASSGAGEYDGYFLKIKKNGEF